MAFHHVLTGQDIHTTIAFEYADAAARIAAEAAMVGAGTHVGKVARQLDDDSLWMIKSVTPAIVWSSLEGDPTVVSTAGNAYAIAVAGTQAAHAADLTAREAYSLAMKGTTAAASADMWGRTAYSLAVAGTTAAAAANIAAGIAQGMASSAIDIGLSANTTARHAFNIAIAGTNAANAADLTAREAYALAMVGTIPPYLDELQDVAAGTPNTNQVLMWDGANWINADVPTQVAPGAFTLFLEDTPSGISTYFNLFPVPSGAPENADPYVVGGGTPLVYADAYISDTLNRSFISAGVWEFNTYLSNSTASRPFASIVEVLTRTSGGVETLLFAGTTGDVTATSPALYTTIISQGSYAVATTDRLLVKYAFLRNSVTTTTATMYHNGSTHDSHFHTPIGFAHNDLEGLQGGNSVLNEFYHATQSQHEALSGSAGTPSSTNVYVTTEDSRLASATLALQTAWAGTNTANLALPTAQGADKWGRAAYSMAVDGTNAASAAQQSANQALLEVDTVSTLVYAGQTGTYADYVSQVAGGKPDVPITIKAGIVTNQGVATRFAVQGWLDPNQAIGMVGTSVGEPSMVAYSGWNGTGVVKSWMKPYYQDGVVNEPFNAIVADEFNLPTGTLGVELADALFNTGTGWSGGWSFSQTFQVVGTETFVDYAFVATPGTIGAFFGTFATSATGIGFSGTFGISGTTVS